MLYRDVGRAGEGRAENCRGKLRALKLESQGRWWRLLRPAAVMWVILICSLESCCASHGCLQVWLPPQTENHGFTFSSAAQSSRNFPSEGNSTQSEIGRRSSGKVASQTVEGCGYEAEWAAGNTSQHPHPVSDVSTWASIFWWPTSASHQAQHFICFLNEALQQP